MKRIISYILGIVLLLSFLSGCSQSVSQGNQGNQGSSREKLRLGERYLEERHYEQALVQFLGVVDIESENVRGYTGAAEAYIGLGDMNWAAQILQMGLNNLPESAALLAMLNDLEQPQTSVEPERIQEVEESADDPTPPSLSTGTPKPDEPSEVPPSPTETQPPSAPPAPITSAKPDVPIGVDIGMRAPDFTLSLWGGGTVTLSQLLGKPVLINVGATWCPPCQVEFPEIQEILDSYGDRIHVIIICYYETESEVEAYFGRLGFTFPIAYDPTGATFESYYSFDFIPQSWILDADGVIVDYVPGATDARYFSAAIDRAFS